MKKFWRSVREEVISWPIWCLWLGFFVGSFFCSSPTIPMWSWLNALASVVGSTLYIGVFYIIKYFCRRSLKKEDERNASTTG